MVEDTGSAKAAQQRVNQIDAFRHELTELERAGLITFEMEDVRRYHDDLLQDLKRRYDVDLDTRSRQLSLGMRIWSFLGALALAASVFFFFYQIWGYLGTAPQVTLLVGASITTLAVTFIVHRYEQATHFTNLSALVAFACFVLNISMLGAIFNLTSSDYAMLLFCAYAGVLAYAFGLRLLLAMAVLCFYAFVAARVGAWSGIYWLSLGQRPENFLLPALLLFWVPVFVPRTRYADFEPVYRVLAMTGFFLTVLVMSNWGASSYLRFDPRIIQGVYQFLGFALSAAAIWLGLKMHWRDTVVTGNVFFVLFLYTKFFDWWWDWMPKSVFFLIVGATALLALVVFRRLRIAETAP